MARRRVLRVSPWRSRAPGPLRPAGTWLPHAPKCYPFYLHTPGHAGYLLLCGAYDLWIRTIGYDCAHVSALVTGEFAARWGRRAVDIVDGHLVGTENRAVGTVMPPIPHRLSTGCRGGGRTCAPFCAHGSRDNRRRLQEVIESAGHAAADSPLMAR
jgi:hypothetical protein